MKKVNRVTRSKRNVTPDQTRTLVIIDPMDIIRQAETALEEILEITRYRSEVLPEAPYQLRQEDKPRPLYFD